MPKSLTVVIGGKHKAGAMTMYRDGKPSGTIYLKGVGKSTHAILHKLNFGERNEFHTWNGKKESMERFKNARYVGYHFMEEGFSNSTQAISDAMTMRYAKLLHKAVNRANIRIEKREVS